MLSAAPRIPHQASHSTLHAPRSTPHSAVALVITLVLLSVITFMAVTFLVLSRSQHGAVAIETDQAIARLAADTARERAIAELLAPMMASGNALNYGLLVSANYTTPGGFATGHISPDPLDASYYYPDGTFLKSGPPNYDLEHNIANLLYSPRAPVFIVTNALGSNDFRFYIDLNRNLAFDPSTNDWVGDPQWIGGLQRPEFAHSATNLFTHRYAYLVVPAGQTLDLNFIHNQASRPQKTQLDPLGGDFVRDQGVGTYEINLAAFLYDLNTNYWSAGYIYDPIGGCKGTAFADAGALLAYRYAFNLTTLGYTLASVEGLFPGNAANGAFPGAPAFQSASIDGYSAGPVMTGMWWSPPPTFYTWPTRHWSGADSPNRFYSIEDLFDQTKTYVPPPGKPQPSPPCFTSRLLAAGAQTNAYDHYTFYRLLSQLGTDSAPEPGGKMNLNYCNVDTNTGYVMPNMATNFASWEPTSFFLNAAIRLLADAGYTAGYSNFNNTILVTNVVPDSLGNRMLVTNLHIPIWPTNFYTPSVHRLFQLAANMYDATTNRTDLTTTYSNLPTVFRPIFSPITAGGGSGGGGSAASSISIIGYREVTAADTPNLVFTNWTVCRDLSDPNDFANFNPTNDLVYGIPLVIGAKKGLPNFNKLAMQTMVQVTRKLQFRRPTGSTTLPVNEIDQMYVLGISNVLGVEAWNSYAANFSREVQMVVWPDVSVLLTNRDTGRWQNQPPLFSRWRLYPNPAITNIAANMWPGYDNTESPPSFDFQIPLVTNLVFLTNSTYSQQGDGFMPLTGTFESPGHTNFYLPPHWELTFKPRLRFAIVDKLTQRILDYVNLADYNVLDVTNVLATGGQCGVPYTKDGGNGSMWCTTRVNGGGPNALSDPTFGIANQILASKEEITADWTSSTHEFPPGMDQAAAITFFQGQFTPGYAQSSNIFSAPFQPFRNVYLVTSWQANDPLVHYTVGDLVDVLHANVVVDNFTSTEPRPTDNLGQLNSRYSPWGGNPVAESRSATMTEMRVKDPSLRHSDGWEFPTNKFPNVGWLGRVHRGTPWQTVYWKPYSIDLPTWQRWTGNPQSVTNFGQFPTNVMPLYIPGTLTGVGSDAFLTQPTNDWHLLDLFTTALNDNATRGQLSINQTNLTAWSAVLSGVTVLTNNLDDGGAPITDANGNPVPAWLAIQPAGVYDPLDPTTWPPIVRLVKAINDVRTNNVRHVFSRLSDLLAVPELTVASPFLYTNGTPSYDNNGLSDAFYERLPQQIAGLLKVDTVPRFVIYAFGQTLKPESTRAFVRGGPFSGLCTNYQIMAEVATRTVVRFEGVPPLQGGVAPPITTLHPVIESFNVLPPD